MVEGKWLPEPVGAEARLPLVVMQVSWPCPSHSPTQPYVALATSLSLPPPCWALLCILLACLSENV